MRGLQKRVARSLAGPRQAGLAVKDARIVSKVVSALVLPKESAPLRIGSGAYGSDPTGACNPWKEWPISFNDGVTPSTKDVGNMIFAFRSCLRATVYSYNSNGKAYQYYGIETLRICGGERAYFNPGALEDQSALPGPHGPNLYSGRTGLADPERGFWADTGTSIEYVVGACVGGSTLYIHILDGREWRSVHAIQVPPAGVSFSTTALESGYYSFSLRNFSDAVAVPLPESIDLAITFKWGDNGQCWGHLPINDMEKQFASVDRVRMIGSSVMITNNSAAIQKQGTCVGVQLDCGTNWQEFTTFRSLSELRKAHIRPSDNGIYGFLKPSDPKDFDFIPEFQRSIPTNGVGPTDSDQELSMLPELSDAAFLIIPNQPFIGAAIDVSQSLTGVTGYFTTAWSLEWLSNDMWRSLAMSDVDDITFSQAVHFITVTPQWHANGNHLEDLWSSIKSVAKSVVDGVMEYGPKILSAAAMVAPLLL